MAHTVQFLLTLLATVSICTVGIVQSHEADVVGERLVGVIVLIGVPLVLGSWFGRLRRSDPPIWWDLRQRLPGATGERLPILEPIRENLFFPLPWFLLPLIPIAASLAIVTGRTVLFWVPAAITVGWVGVVGAVAAASAARHRGTETSGVDRMLADFRQSAPLDGTDMDHAWAQLVFDRHRLGMDVATLETLSGAGMEDAHGHSDRPRRVDPTKLAPRYAREGWLCVLEKEGLIQRDESQHRARTDPPQERHGWQCPRCHAVNEPGARRCTLSTWDLRPLCRERRPGLSRVAELVRTSGEVVVAVVFIVLEFGPILLAILAIYGLVNLVGSGDPTTLVAVAVLTAAWLVLIRLPAGLAREAREGLEFLVAYLGWVALAPFFMLADALRRVFRIGQWVDIVADGSTLVVRPSSVRAGTVRFRASNAGNDEELLISIVQTSLPPNTLPVDLEAYLARRPVGATLVGEAVVDEGESERTDLTLAPGQYVIGCQPWAGVAPEDASRYSVMRATLRAVP